LAAYPRAVRRFQVETQQCGVAHDPVGRGGGAAVGRDVGVDGRLGLKGGPVLIGRSTVAGDYEAAAKVFEFGEKETGTGLSV
jgi:hypothetical protein